MGIEEKVGAIEAVHKGCVVGSDAVRVEQFPRVESIVTGGLQPNGEEVLVEALGDEFGVSAYAALAFLCRGSRPIGEVCIPYGGFTSVTLVL